MLSKKYVSLIAIVGLAVVIVLIAPMIAQTMGLAMGIVSVTSVFAQTTNMHNNVPSGDFHRGQGFGRDSKVRVQPGVFGTVSAISGSTLTVTGKNKLNSGTGTTYTVDASNATVTKNGTSSSVTSIAVGDTVMIQGTVNGSNVIATAVRDNVPRRGQKTKPNPIIQGNGEPIVSGSITAINGTTVTITNKSNVTYIIDASNATIEKDNATSTLSSVAAGDNVIVQGAVNGTSVIASSIIDQGGTANAASSKPHPGFFGGIINFFQHLFGF